MLLCAYRQLEAYREIRDGRFVDSLVGTQFALPETISRPRATRARADDGEWICLSDSERLNLAGTALTGDKVPALAVSRVLFRDGMPIAAPIGGKLSPRLELFSKDTQLVRQALLRQPLTSAVAH